MRIFVHEHVTGGRGCGERLPGGLALEGLAMLQAIVEDISLTGEAEVVTTIDHRFSISCPSANVTALRISSAAMLEAEFDALAASSDGTLLIAPELDGLSASLARRVLEVGGRLLGSEPTAMETASDKLLLPRRLAGRGVPCVPSEPFDGGGDEPPRSAFPFPVVVKPRRGAGSTETFLARRLGDLPAVLRESVVTPLLPGVPASVLVLVGPRARLPLCPSEQILSGDGRFQYLGGRMPLEGDLARRAADLALRAVQCVPGLGGFVGVDMLLHTDGAGEPADRVVEINSRLTTSYVGLRKLATSNLASAWLGVLDGRRVPAPTWRGQQIRFHPDGSVEELQAC